MRSELSVGLDFTRVIACLMVVILHLSAGGAGQFDANWVFSNIYNSLVRACVPIFLMLSGALLLNRKENAIDFYKNRFIRIFPPLMFWTGFYVAWRTYIGSGYGTIYEALLDIVNGPVFYHLWYLYMLIGMYLFIPFLSRIYQSTTKLEKHVYLSLWFVVASIIPIFTYFYPNLSSLIDAYELYSFTGFGGYLFLGAYVFEQISVSGKGSSIRLDVLLFFLSSFLTFFATYLLSMHDGLSNQLFYSYLSPLVVLASVFGFKLLIIIGSKISKYSRLLSELAGCTLGIYCIHAFVMNRLSLIYGPLIEGYSMLWVIPVLSVLVFLLSLIPVYLLRTFKKLRIII